MERRELPRGRAAGLPDEAPPGVVTYPDELLEEAVAKMARHRIGRLPVVVRDHPDHVLGHLGRAEIAGAWHRLLEEEHVREGGWLSRRVRLMRRNVRRALGRSPARR